MRWVCSAPDVDAFAFHSFSSLGTFGGLMGADDFDLLVGPHCFDTLFFPSAFGQAGLACGMIGVNLVHFFSFDVT